MITNKDKTGRYMDRVESFIPKDILNAFADEVFDGTAFQPDEIKTCAEWIWSKASEQARKEAVCKIQSLDCVNDNSSEIRRQDAVNAILDDSTTDRIPDTGEKLAIAVKALEDIKKIGKAGPAFETHFSKLQYIGAVTNDALREIQG